MGTLIDAGPLVAVLNRSERTHGTCVRTLAQVSMPLVTTWPCVTEAMYLLGREAGRSGQALLWSIIEHGQLEVHPSTAAEARRMRVLMEKYQDAPMDLADASLVAAAETRELRRVFTFDNHFRVYRAHNREPFEVVP